jgi:hypothetical protein
MGGGGAQENNPFSQALNLANSIFNPPQGK